MTDTEIIKLILDGEDRCFNGLVVKYRDDLYKYVYRKIHNINDTDILTIEIFTKAWQNLSTYKESDGTFKVWLFSIANNHIIDYARKKKRTPTGNDNEYNIDSTSNIASLENSPEEAIIHTEKNKVVTDVMTLLKPIQRQLLHMQYWENKSYEEMAQTLNIPMGTVKTELHRAKLNLAKILKDNKNLK